MNYVMPHQFMGEPHATNMNGFTFGHKYRIIDRCNRTVTVRNDNGHSRVIIPGANSPHITHQSGDMLGWTQKCVGYFSEYDE